MKKLYIIFLLVGLFMSSCKKDLGNYDYKELEEITITGIETTYAKLTDVDRITLDPTVTSSVEAAEFEYLWGIYETNVTGRVPVMDTIAKTKALDYPVKLVAKEWVLVFRATNKKTGYSKYVKSRINVGTEYTRGWYVAKDDGIQADMDLFLTPQTIVPERLRENVFSSVNGKKLEGKAKLISFYHDYKSAVSGTMGNTRSIFLTTERDLSVVDVNTMKEIHDFNGLFYGAPQTKAPDFVANGSQSLYLANEGQLRGIGTMSGNTGVFGERQLINSYDTPYRLSRFFMAYTLGSTVFFDEISSSFISSSGSGNVMTALVDAKETQMPAANTNKIMLFMGARSMSPFVGYAVLQDKTDPTKKTITKITRTSTTIDLQNEAIKVTDKIYNAERYALNDTDESIIYFTVGNEVWSRNLSNGHELLQFTAAAGEEITFLRHRKYTGLNAEAPYTYNYVMVGTTSGGKYKVRMFAKTSGNLASDPAFVLEGNGIPRDVMYMAPLVGGFTYLTTY
ncbi:PKD-like family lipoprotein [Pedobacter nyackensis]|uniref:PKD-like family lipoprotein n=1 Tax=Pedobacter nyackensis TaxID=475255 RepID=UPI0029302F45|nr:PKD-like family lipoprotein [Pedobacter nyackensis]